MLVSKDFSLKKSVKKVVATIKKKLIAIIIRNPKENFKKALLNI